ncbi:MAG: hypothetical protein ACO1OT_05595 [Heyndrickxia sp.]
MNKEAMAMLIDIVADVQFDYRLNFDEMSKMLFRLALDYVKQDQQERELHL